jgi:hypothetical protein
VKRKRREPSSIDARAPKVESARPGPEGPQLRCPLCTLRPRQVSERIAKNRVSFAEWGDARARLNSSTCALGPRLAAAGSRPAWFRTAR